MREMLLVPALLLGLAGAAPTLAQEALPAPAEAAAEQPPAEAAPAAAHPVTEGEAGHGQGAGMPQLDTSTYTSQIFWLILSFGALFYLLRKRALPRVAEILEVRQERIAADLDRAASLRAEAEAVLRRYEAMVAEARAKTAAQLRAAQERMAAEAAARRAPLEQELQQKLAAAEQRIAAAKAAALKEIEAVAAEAAQAAAAHLAGLEVGAADARKALLAELEEAA